MSVRSCRNRIASLGLFAALALTGQIGVAQAQTRAFDIPAEPAAKAISDFARQSGLQVVAPARQLRGVTTPAIRGDLDAREALRRLLANTGLEVASDSGTLIVLRRAALRPTSPPLLIPPAAAAAPTPEAQAAATITEIVVTADRLEALASRTPSSITAVSGDTLASEGVSNPTRLGDLVPNLSVVRGNGLQITIRGVTSTDGTEKGDPSAAFLSNGIYIARPQAHEVSFFDLERIEVLRGPQGTLYGRNATAGVINLISALPGPDYGGALDLTYGAYGTTQTTGVVNLPINEQLGVRVAANYDARDSYLTQTVPQPFGTRKYKDTASARLTALLKPDDRLQIKTIVDGSRIRDAQSVALLSNFYQAPFTPPTAGGRGVDPAYVDPSPSRALARTYAGAQPEWARNTTWGALGQLTYSPAENWSLTWLGSYRALARQEAGNAFLGSAVAADGRLAGASFAPSHFSGDYSQNSHELRAAFSGDRLRAQGGVYYFREDYDIELLFTGVLGAPGERGYVFGFPQTGLARTTGVFGQATYALDDRWRITAGARTTRDEKFREGATSFRASRDEPTNFTTSTPPGTTNPENFRDSLNVARLATSKVTWKVATDFDLTPEAMVYATVSTGYKAGGFNDGCLAGQPNCSTPLPRAALFYEPETITSYETGAKLRLREDRLRLVATYFHYDYNNLQLSQLSSICGGPCQVTTNAASAKVDGLELEGVMALDAHNRIDFSSTWLDARYADWLLLPTFNFAGAALDRAPRWTLSGGYTYSHPLADGASLIASLRSGYSDRYALINTMLRAQFWQPAFSKTDVSVTYASGRAWSLQAFVRNIEGGVQVTSAALPADFPAMNDGTANFSDPRTWGLRLNARF